VAGCVRHRCERRLPNSEMDDSGVIAYRRRFRHQQRRADGDGNDPSHIFEGLGPERQADFCACYEGAAVCGVRIDEYSKIMLTETMALRQRLACWANRRPANPRQLNWIKQGGAKPSFGGYGWRTGGIKLGARTRRYQGDTPSLIKSKKLRRLATGLGGRIAGGNKGRSTWRLRKNCSATFRHGPEKERTERNTLSARGLIASRVKELTGTVLSGRKRCK